MIGRVIMLRRRVDSLRRDYSMNRFRGPGESLL